ncbi:MAG: FtsX-like permease family protein [Pseudomonadota bacterium]
MQLDNQLLILFFTLASHWRQKPLQLATMIVGLAAATALFSGVQALNEEARASYAEASDILGANQFSSIVAKDRQTFPQEKYIDLRRRGLPVTPVIHGSVKIDGISINLMGIDIVTLPQSNAPVTLMPDPSQGSDNATNQFDLVKFITPPWQAAASPVLIDRLRISPDTTIDAQDHGSLPPLFPLKTVPPQTIILDIGAAQSILEMAGVVSELFYVGDHMSPQHRKTIISLGFDILDPGQENDIEQLTSSFHLNLAAFGFLSFLVGLLIVHAAAGLAFEQRRPIFRTLMACGINRSTLMFSLTLEVMIIAIVAGTIGIFLGYIIAASLLPDVSKTLQGLYGAVVADTLVARPLWLLLGLGMSIAGAFIASARFVFQLHGLPILKTAYPEAWRAKQSQSLRWQSIGAGLFLILLVISNIVGSGLLKGFVMMGCLLCAAALLLPACLTGMLALASRFFSKTVLLEWFFADTRQQLSGLSLALQALLLALAVNIGVGTMVGSFRTTFTSWLDQRLAAELYVNPGDNVSYREIENWLSRKKGVKAVLPAAFKEARSGGLPLSIFAFTPNSIYRDHWPLLDKSPDAWDRLKSTENVLINEQFARRENVWAGDSVAVTLADGEKTAQIVGVYSDYGNTKAEIMVPLSTLTAWYPATEASLFVVRADPSLVSELVNDLKNTFSLNDKQLIDQQALKSFSVAVFEQTFLITNALNVLTLIIAGIALFTSLLSLATARLPQLAPLWAVGVPRAILSRFELARALVLALMTSVLALPLGISIAWMLTAIVNVEAFGWKLPIIIFPGDLFTLMVLAAGTAFASAFVPALQLRRTSNAQLLRLFAQEK